MVGDGDGSGGGGGGGGGWEVDFSLDSDPKVNRLGRQRIQIKKEQLVIGLANGWTTPPPNSKFLLIWPEACVEAYAMLRNDVGNAEAARSFLGYMFWNLEDEGNEVQLTKAASESESEGRTREGEGGSSRKPPAEETRVLHLARGLNAIRNS